MTVPGPPAVTYVPPIDMTIGPLESSGRLVAADGGEPIPAGIGR
jgi:hypothetical protein